MIHNEIPNESRYIVAVSGGVDSMVLLHLLQQRGLDLVVAHFDHGIRADSRRDRELVEAYATSHNIEFVWAEDKLGPEASEEQARNARYAFLLDVCKKYNASAIVTAHHRDDLLETALINILRGTGRRGLAALRSYPNLIRPLLDVGKAEILEYARQQGVVWREDSTNQVQKYLRNYVRHSLLRPAGEQVKEKLYQIIVRQKALDQDIERELAAWFKTNVTIEAQQAILPRHQLIMLPASVAAEVLQHTLRVVSGSALQRPLLAKALLFIKTARPHKRFALNKSWELAAATKQVIVRRRPTVLS